MLEHVCQETWTKMSIETFVSNSWRMGNKVQVSITIIMHKEIVGY